MTKQDKATQKITSMGGVKFKISSSKNISPIKTTKNNYFNTTSSRPGTGSSSRGPNWVEDRLRSIDGVLNLAMSKAGLTDRPLIQALILWESNANHLIKIGDRWEVNASYKDGKICAIGLMMVKATNCLSYNLNDIDQNATRGCEMFSDAMNHWGNNVEKALAQYNGGPGAAKKYGQSYTNAETNTYVPAIISIYNCLSTGDYLGAQQILDQRGKH